MYILRISVIGNRNIVFILYPFKKRSLKRLSNRNCVQLCIALCKVFFF